MGSNTHRIDRHSPIAPAATSCRSFYKIILPSVMLYRKLRIPEDFSNKYGNELSTLVRFTVRSGQVCHVAVEKADKMLWFTDGWEEFCENHSIGCGFFLVFNYEGNSNFNIHIFDLTATEIYNPRKNLGIYKEPHERKQCPVSCKRERESNDTLENARSCPSKPAHVSLESGILDGCWDQRRTDKKCCHSLIQNMYEFAPEFALRIKKRGRCISSLESLRCNSHYFTRNKLCKMEDRGKIDKVDKGTGCWKDTMIITGMPNSKRSLAHNTGKKKWNAMKNVDKEPHERKQCPISCKRKRESNDTLENLRSCPSTPAHVSLESGILDGYWDQRRTDKRCCHSLIQNMYEFAPEFALRIKKRGRCISSLDSLRCNSHYFTRNKLCKMEDRGKIVKVDKGTGLRNSTMITRDMPNSRRSSAHNTGKMKWNAMKNVDNVPAAAVPFARHCCRSNEGREDKEGQHNQTDSVFVQEATQKCEGRGYQLNETIHTKSADALNPSNAPNHQRNDSTGQQLKVKREEEEELLGVNDFKNGSMMRPVTIREREKAFSDVIKFKLNNPFFTRVIQPYNVHKGFLNVPVSFAKEHLQVHEVLGGIQLEVSDGKQWTVHCVGRGEDIVQCLSGGWFRFSKDNNLGTGDVCVFERIQAEDVVLKVSIFRTNEEAMQTHLPNLNK